MGIFVEREVFIVESRRTDNARGALNKEWGGGGRRGRGAHSPHSLLRAVVQS